jgi:adenylate cyclase
MADTFIRYQAGGKDIELPIERLSICGFGRSPSNAVVLANSSASREHAIIRRNATGHCILNDLGSTNGTFLNGRPVTTPTQLKTGDVIAIGQQAITFVQTLRPGTIFDPQHGRTLFLMERQLVSVLVIDLRSYTSLSAAMGPERTGDMMGEIFRDVGERLHEANCWSTKYIGDAVMALWIHPSDALRSSDIVNVFDVISAYQAIFRAAESKFEPPVPLRFGCGFNAGMASIGNIGGAGSADFTAMGEAVNTAFRLESATKGLGQDLLISQGVFEALSDVDFVPEELIDVECKGYDQPVPAVPLLFEEIGDFLDTLLAAAEAGRG